MIDPPKRTVVVNRNKDFDTKFLIDVMGYSEKDGRLSTLTLNETDCNHIIDRLMQELWDKRLMQEMKEKENVGQSDRADLNYGGTK